MADLERRRGQRMSRGQREKRAYTLVLATGGLALAGTVGLLLALVSVIGYSLPIILLVLAALCFFLLRGVVKPK
ncbi:MAG: hypothetical protein ACR2ML_12720 [Solirubrobacteraceae bacterium]